MAMEGSILGDLNATVCELDLLLEARDGDMALAPGFPALFEARVVELLVAREDACERLLQLLSRTELVLELLAHGRRTCNAVHDYPPQSSRPSPRLFAAERGSD